MKSYKVFVSSTFVDLKKHRARVISALRKAGFFVDPMEDWTAATDEPKRFSQARIEGCDLCILLIARRRGHVPRGEHQSITQMEVDAAVALGVPVLVFMLVDSARWPARFDEMARDRHLRDWRRHWSEAKGVGFFGANPGSIDLAPALTRWVSETRSVRAMKRGPGWRRRSIPRSSPSCSPFKWPSAACRTRPSKNTMRLTCDGNTQTPRSRPIWTRSASMPCCTMAGARCRKRCSACIACRVRGPSRGGARSSTR